MLFLFTSSDFSPLPSTLICTRSNKSIGSKSLKMSESVWLTHTRLKWSFTWFPSGADLPASPDVLTLLLQLVYVGLVFIHLRLLGQGEKDCATQQASWKLSLMTWMMETCLPFSLFLSDLISFPSLLQFNRQMNVSAALVQNFAFRFLPLLRVSVPGPSPQLQQSEEGQRVENKGFSNWST